MPRISYFFGIAIFVYYREHPPTHFHAIYSDDQVLVEIETLSVLSGRLPPRAMGMVVEWAALHQDELRRVWEQALAYAPLDRIAPLTSLGAVMRRIMVAWALPGYRLWVRFSDGVEGEISLADLVGKGVFASWNDPEEFAKVSIDSEAQTVTWPGGVELCPDSLYEDIVAQRATR